MKKTITNILIIAGLVAGTWFAKGYIDPTPQTVTRTDTVYVDKPYKVTEIKEGEKPVTVTKYKTEYDTVTNIVHKTDTVYVETNEDTFFYDPSFFSSYPNAPKFLGLTHHNRQVELTYLRTMGEVEAKTWNVGDLGYKIGLEGNVPSLQTLSKEDKISFSHGISAGVEKGIECWSPYAEYEIEFSFYDFPITAKAHVSRNPFVSAGIGYMF